MDWMTFVAKLIESLAWPVAAVALVFLLRDDIRRLVPFIKKLKAGPVEAEFEREVNALKEAAPLSAHGITVAKAPDAASKEFLLQLAELHPRSAILESWVRVEAAARAILARKATSTATGAYIPAARLVEPLAEQKLITPGHVTLFHELRRLRNEVAHAQGFEPTIEAAKAYADLASFLQGDLEGKAK